MKSIVDKIFIISFLWICLLLVGCHRSTAEPDSYVMEMTFEETPNSFRLTEIFKNVSCVQLEMTEESIIGRVEQIFPTDSSLIVFGDNEILLFNREDGKFIRQIGSVGEGPEEYLEILGLAYLPKQKEVVAYDVVSNRFITYGLDGEFRGTKKPDRNFSRMASMEIEPRGDILVCNYVDSRPDDCAFTFVGADGSAVGIDPLSPLQTDNKLSRWAEKPMSVNGDEFKFVKCFGDTMFTLKDGDVSPLYKLNLGKVVPSKEIISKFGPFPGKPDYLGECMGNNWFTGVDKLFETTDHLVMVPHASYSDGYYWIDKKEQRGYKIPSTPLFEEEVGKVLEGETIVWIAGSGESEIISGFKADVIANVFKKVIAAKDGIVAFPENVVTALEELDPDGNPFVIIYSY